jgi:hypothetical protein
MPINNPFLKKYNTHLVAFFLCVIAFPIGVVYLLISSISNKVKLLILIIFVFLLRYLIVIYFIFYGWFIYPEAARVLAHYCFGNGNNLCLDASYIKHSPVIQKHLKKMKVGEKKRIAVKQNEDYRLTYALNGFEMEKQKNKTVITQYIQFDTTGKVFTFVGPFRVSDNLVHVFNCTPYMVRCEFEI